MLFEIPPTAVGGSFILDLQRPEASLADKYHQPQLVDSFISSLIGESLNLLSGTNLHRQGMNNPPTAVGGIHSTPAVSLVGYV